MSTKNRMTTDMTKCNIRKEERMVSKTVRQIRTEHLGDESSWVMMLPVIVYSAIVILIVRVKYYYMPMSQFSWTGWTDDGQLNDFFTKQKMEVIVACAVIATCILLYKFTVAELQIKKTWLYYPIAFYVLFVVLSYVFSDYKEFALWGWTERFEGTIPLLCYMVMLFYVINVVNSEKNIKFVISAVGVSVFGMSLLGLTQLLDIDFFKTAIGQKLMVANDSLNNGYTFWQQIDKDAANGFQTLQFNMEPGTVYQTVFNINYVSFYLALLIPIFSMLFFYSIKKENGVKWWKISALGVLLVLMIINDIGSKSSAGYIGLIVAFVVAIVVLNKRLIKNYKFLIVFCSLSIIILFSTANRWKPELKTAFQNLRINSGYLNPVQMDYIENDGLDIKLSINGEPLKVGLAVEGNQMLGLYAYDGNENFLELIAGEGEADNTFSFADSRFAPYIALEYGPNEYEYFELDLIVAGVKYRFVFGGNTFYYLTDYGRLALLEPVPYSRFFAIRPQFGSWRGYIWSRALPLLSDNLLWGSGADTFCIVFPQNDVAGRFSTYYYTVGPIVIDKPHNMYLGVGIGTGCVSLLALLTLFGGYIIQTLKLLWKRDYGNDFLAFLSAGILFGTIGFLVSALADDSSVCIMPLFYTMLGIGISININLKKKDAVIAE